MLKRVRIENYRGYSEHEMEFRELTIAVGKNNAGKSTLIEALRLIALVANKYQNSPYRNVPGWLKIPLINKGVSPSLQRMDFSFANIYFSYNDPPAIILAEFANGTKIKIYFAGDKKFHAVLYEKNDLICSQSRLKQLKLPSINILPQIYPLLAEEKVLNEDYVKNNLDAPTSSRHFRNQLNYLRQYYSRFDELIELTWEEIQLGEYSPGNRVEELNPFLIVREGAFATEIGNMGHGLQMWMQTMWFLARCSNSSTIILDEPDVYMHADLQRKLIRILKNEFQQVIIATHSVEMMAEVEPENILVIDRKKEKSIFASDFNAVQRVLLNMGSIQNIALARLWSAKKFLIVEGKDIDILRILQNTMFKLSKDPFDAIPRMTIGGWGGWGRAVGSKIMLKNAGNEDIATYCILDRDYHSDAEIANRYDEANKNGIILKIWTRKEIENYLIIPEAICRIIKKEAGQSISIENVKKMIRELIDECKDEYIDHITDKLHAVSRKAPKILEPSTARKMAIEQVNAEWINSLFLVSGKLLISKVSGWTHNAYGVSINSKKLAQAITHAEIPEEMRTLISAIERRVDLPTSYQ